MKLLYFIYVIAYLFLITIILVLPFFSFEGYSMYSNTISELGAQLVPNNWVINCAIASMSMAVIILGSKKIRLFSGKLIALFSFGVSFFFTAIYSLAGPIEDASLYNYTHDALHTIFSNVTGIAFCCFCVLLLSILKIKKHKLQTLTMLTLAMGLPFLMFKFPDFRGIFQRILFTLSFGWLFVALVNYKFKEKKMSTV